MVGCIVIVCKLLGQLEDADYKQNRTHAAQSSDSPENPPTGQDSPGDPNQLNPRPSVIGQTWIESGILIIIHSNLIYPLVCSEIKVEIVILSEYVLEQRNTLNRNHFRSIK